MIMNYCSECGAEVEEDQTYCLECGVRLDQSEDTGGSGGSITSVVAGIGISLIDIVVLVILMAVVGTFVLGLGEDVDGGGESSGTGQSSSSDAVTHEIGETFTWVQATSLLSTP
jgi:hypothetical protein